MKGKYGYVPITRHAHDAGMYMYIKQHGQSRLTSMNSVEMFGQIQNVRMCMDIIRDWIESTHCNIIIKVRIIILRSSKYEQFVGEVRTKQIK